MYLSFIKQQYARTEAHMQMLFITIGTYIENKRKACANFKNVYWKTVT